MNENIILQIKQIENKIRRLEKQRKFYKDLIEEKNDTPDRDHN